MKLFEELIFICRLNTYRGLFLRIILLIITCVGCSGENDHSDAAQPQSSANGSASLAINWRSTDDQTAVQKTISMIGLARPDRQTGLSDNSSGQYTTTGLYDCGQRGIKTISCSVYSNNYTLFTESDIWSCGAVIGGIEAVPAGDFRTFVCLGFDDTDSIIYQGQLSDVSIIADKVNEVGTVDAYPFTVQPTWPAQDSLASFQRLSFEWSEIANASQYRIQIAQDSDFENLTIDQRVAQPRHNVTGLEPGTTYYWRVYAIDAYGHIGKNSSTSSFVTIENSSDDQTDDGDDGSINIVGNWNFTETFYYQYYDNLCGVGQLALNGTARFAASDGMLTEYIKSGDWCYVATDTCEVVYGTYSGISWDISDLNISDPLSDSEAETFCAGILSSDYQNSMSVTVNQFSSEQIICRYDATVPSTSEIWTYLTITLTRAN